MKKLKDIAFANIDLPLPLPILTNRLCDYEGQIVVAEGENKVYIDECTIGKADNNKEYVITGCIRNEISGMRMNRNTTFRGGIHYTDKTHLGSFFVFENPNTIIYDDWKGLSGSPVFNEVGQIIGMLNEVVDGSKELYVTPIHAIIQLIDYSIFHDNSMNQ